jgi:hypothetical protein
VGALGDNMLRKMFKWGGVTFGCIVLIYVVWVLIAMSRTVNISVDYVSILNEKATSIPEKQAAWPLYREAGLALQKFPRPGNVFFEEDIEEPNWPDQVGWNHVNSWLLQHQNTLNLIRQGSTRQGLGFILAGAVAEEDKELWPEEYESQQGLLPHDGFLVSILLPQLGNMRNMAQLLDADAKDAAVSGDAKRCKEDLQAMLSLGRQVREHPLLINDLVSFSIFKHVFKTLQDVLDNEPNLFSTEHLSELSSDLKLLTEHLVIRFEGERLFILDMLQRMYTDDGNGDGNIVPVDGGRAFLQLETVSVESKSSSLLPVILAPIADIYLASRKEMREEYNRRIAYFERVQDLLLDDEEAQIPPEPWTSATSTINPYFLMELLTPAYIKAIEHAVETKNTRDRLIDSINKLQRSE